MKLIYPMQTAPIAADVPKARKVYFEVFGCQMNKLDAELMLEGLLQKGYHLVHDPEEAGVILYNTCSVRELEAQPLRFERG